MSHLEIVQPVIIDEVEFYCSSDGSQVGMSQSGLALFCGTSRRSLQRLLENTCSKNAPKELETLHSMEIYLRTITSNQQAKVVDADVCAEIVWYYAIEKQNPIATRNLKKLNNLGMRTFIKKITGFSEKETLMPTDLLNQILETCRRMESKVEVLDKFNKTTVTLPGLQRQFKDYVQQEGKVFDTKPFTLSQWLTGQGIELTLAQKQTLGRLIADLYKCNKQEKPQKMRNYKVGLENTGTSTVYRSTDIPMLNVALEQFLEQLTA